LYSDFLLFVAAAICWLFELSTTMKPRIYYFTTRDFTQLISTNLTCSYSHAILTLA